MNNWVQHFFSTFSLFKFLVSSLPSDYQMALFCTRVVNETRRITRSRRDRRRKRMNKREIRMWEEKRRIVRCETSRWIWKKNNKKGGSYSQYQTDSNQINAEKWETNVKGRLFLNDSPSLAHSCWAWVTEQWINDVAPPPYHNIKQISNFFKNPIRSRDSDSESTDFISSFKQMVKKRETFQFEIQVVEIIAHDKWKCWERIEIRRRWTAVGGLYFTNTPKDKRRFNPYSRDGQFCLLRICWLTRHVSSPL